MLGVLGVLGGQRGRQDAGSEPHGKGMVEGHVEALQADQVAHGVRQGRGLRGLPEDGRVCRRGRRRRHGPLAVGGRLVRVQALVGRMGRMGRMSRRSGRA